MDVLLSQYIKSTISSAAQTVYTEHTPYTTGNRSSHIESKQSSKSEHKNEHQNLSTSIIQKELVNRKQTGLATSKDVENNVPRAPLYADITTQRHMYRHNDNYFNDNNTEPKGYCVDNNYEIHQEEDYHYQEEDYRYLQQGEERYHLPNRDSIVSISSLLKKSMKTRFLFSPYRYRIIQNQNEKSSTPSFKIEPIDKYTPQPPPELQLDFDLLKKLDDENRNYHNDYYYRDDCCESGVFKHIISVYNDSENSPRAQLCRKGSEEDFNMNNLDIDDFNEKQLQIFSPRSVWEHSSGQAPPPGPEIYPFDLFPNVKDILGEKQSNTNENDQNISQACNTWD